METLRARRPDAAIGSFNGLSSHMGRILAIDYGRKRTGLAVTDPLQIIANALDTVPTHTLMDYVKSSYHYQSDRVSRALSDLTGKEDADA